VATPSFVLTDLIPSTEYQINLVAITSVGSGGAAKVTVTTLSSVADGMIKYSYYAIIIGTSYVTIYCKI